jgi:structural maintenance of chromosome 2
MLEETTGTQIYETKKDAAKKAMEKKELKLKEIDELLNNKIIPGIKKLEIEKTINYKWHETKCEIDKLKTIILAYEYMSLVRILNVPQDKIEAQKKKT